MVRTENEQRLFGIVPDSAIHPRGLIKLSRLAQASNNRIWKRHEFNLVTDKFLPNVEK
jgi:hypothetical protein